MNRKRLRAWATGTASAVLVLSASACATTENQPEGSAGTTSGTLNGAGASSQEAAVNTWRKGFQENNEATTVNYDPIGSGGGREQFIAGGVSFAGSDAFLTDDELAAAEQRCSSDVITVPVYVSPIAVVFNLDGVDELNLDPETLGAIFEGTVTKWNDPAIEALNPGVDLPDTKITPVHRADDSGTTKNFTDYLTAASAGAWTGGVVESWPSTGGEAASGTSGVVAAVASGNGTIGYADASQAVELDAVAIRVGDEFVKPSPEAAAKVLDSAERVPNRGDKDISLEIDRNTSASGVYPVVMVSYQLACQNYENAGETALVKSWFEWVTGSEGQAAAARSAGSAPLSESFSETVRAVVETIGS